MSSVPMESEQSQSRSSVGDIPPPTIKRQEKKQEKRVESPSGDTVDSGPQQNVMEPPKYSMCKEKKGHFVIFNHENFTVKNLRKRVGTVADKEGLEKTWKKFGFTVTIHNDLTKSQILETVKNYSCRMDHNDYDCFALAVLTHGGEKDQIFASDGQYHVSELYRPFRDCESLAGKPKMFFIQACRGTDLDHGHRKKGGDVVDAYVLDNRGGDDEVTIPRESDFLIAYSTVEGFFAWRHREKGSWFIQALNECMEKYAAQWDLMTILTKVCCDVSRRTSQTAEQEYHGKKQCPSIVSRLTALIYLKPETRLEEVDHPSAEANHPILMSESSVFERKEDYMAGDHYYDIQMEILKKKKEMLELKEKLCRLKMQEPNL